MAEIQQADVLGSYLSNFRAAQQDRMAQEEHDYVAMQRKNEIIARTAMAADTPEKWQQLVPQAAQQLGWSGELPGFDQRGRIIAESQSVAEQIKQQMDQKEFGLKEGLTAAQIAAQRANAAESYARAAAVRNTATRPGNIDPNTGVRVAPAGVQGRDSGTLKETSNVADAAARAATTLRSVAPALDALKTGPGTSGARTAAGVFSAIGDIASPVTEFLGFGQAFPSAKEFVKNFDAIEQASKDIGIAKLAEIGGSDTERELLTAIKTTVNPDVLPEENMRRFSNQLAAADILAKKAELQTLWVNKAGSLSYALPDGTTWPAFWSKFQKEAWADVRRQQQQPRGNPAPRGNYRDEQRSLLDRGGSSGAVVAPPGYEIIRK